MCLAQLRIFDGIPILPFVLRGDMEVKKAYEKSPLNQEIQDRLKYEKRAF